MQHNYCLVIDYTAEDPGFPGGGATIRLADLRRGCFTAETYAKIKDLGPVGEGGAAGSGFTTAT